MKTLAESILAGRKQSIEGGLSTIIEEVLRELCPDLVSIDIEKNGDYLFVDGGKDTPVLKVFVINEEITGPKRINRYDLNVLDNVKLKNFHIMLKSDSTSVPSFLKNLEDCYISINEARNDSKKFYSNIAQLVRQSKNTTIWNEYSELWSDHNNERYNFDFGSTTKIRISSFFDITNIKNCVCKTIVLPFSYKINGVDYVSDGNLNKVERYNAFVQLIKDNTITSLAESSHSAQYLRYVIWDKKKKELSGSYLKAFAKRVPKAIK